MDDKQLLNENNIVNVISNLIHNRLQNDHKCSHIIMNTRDGIILEKVLSEASSIPYLDDTDLYPLRFFTVNGINLKIVRTLDVPQNYIEVI